MGEQLWKDILSLLGGKTTETISAENLVVKEKLADTYVNQLIEENSSSLINSGSMLKQYLMDSSELSTLFMQISMGFMDKDTKEDIESFKTNLKKLDTADATKRAEIEKDIADNAVTKKSKDERETLLKNFTIIPPTAATDNTKKDDTKKDETSEKSPETVNTWTFTSVDIKDESWEVITKAHLCIPKDYDPTTQPLNIFFCGRVVTVDKMKTTVFSDAKRKPNQAYCILEWTDESKRATRNARYNTTLSKISAFEKGLYANFTSKPKSINIIGHSAGGRAALKYYNNVKSESESTYNLVTVDGVYGDQAQYKNIPDAKVYYVPWWSTQGSQVKNSTAMAGTDHYSIIPKALEDAGVLV
jgi:hypothetical protein